MEKTNFRKIIGTNEYKFIVLGDPHIDSDYSDKKLLKKHLQFAVDNNIDVYCIGDLLDVMQGRHDPRRKNKQDKDHYFNHIINYVTDFLTPYKDVIKFVSYGNHETAVIKNNDLDLLEIIVNNLNLLGANIKLGSYSGWWQFRLTHGTSNYGYKVNYHHGFGGGGKRTKGLIQYTDRQVGLGDVDMIIMGHVHEDTDSYHTIEYINNKGIICEKDVIWTRVSSYKNENIGNGWAVEKGFNPKPVGAKLYTINYNKHIGITETQITRLGRLC